MDKVQETASDSMSAAPLVEQDELTEAEAEAEAALGDELVGAPVSGPPVVEEEEPEEAPVRFTRSQMRKVSLLLGGIGTVFGAAAATFYYADPLFEDMNQDTRDNLTLSMGIVGGLFLSTSLVLFFGSLVSN